MPEVANVVIRLRERQRARNNPNRVHRVPVLSEETSEAHVRVRPFTKLTIRRQIQRGRRWKMPF